MNRNMVAVVVAAVVLSFGGGFLLAKGLDGAFRGHPGGPGGGGIWSMFGHPRDANAPRRGIPKPDGFTVWTTRLDTSGPQPQACLQMTRPLDASKSYADFVLVSPDLGHAPAVSVK